MVGRSPGAEVLGDLVTLSRVGVVANLSDAQLLDRFLFLQGESAEAGVRGPCKPARTNGAGRMPLRFCAIATTPRTLFKQRSSCWHPGQGRSADETRWPVGFWGSPDVSQCG